MINLDTQRSARRGLVETIYGEGKSARSIATALTELQAAHGRALASRVTPRKARDVQRLLPAVCHVPQARMLTLGDPAATLDFRVALMTAGCADAPVACEADVYLRFAGLRPERYDDCGVAGLWRMMLHLQSLRCADVVIVCAGMDGALPAVVAGLLPCPVIGVPTSVGYGVAQGGHAALRTMLSSCAEGVAVVNIDGGLQAAAVCCLMAQVARRKEGQHALAAR